MLFRSLQNQSTRLIIAHRISGVKDANLILYMEHGEIVERGNHHSLLEQQGHYYSIYQDQFQDFLAQKEA